MVLKDSGLLPSTGFTSTERHTQDLFSSLPERGRVAIQSPKREPSHPIKEVTESTDFHCQRTNLV